MRLGKALLSATILGLAFGALVAFLLSLGREEFRPPPPPSVAEETRRLDLEYPLAATRKPYLVLDLTAQRLDYRISGATVKSIPFRLQSLQGAPGRGLLTAGRLTLLTLLDRGAPPEVIKPPEPDAPVDPLKNPKIFPPAPPTDFTLSFDRPVRIRFQAADPKGITARVRGVGRTLREWFVPGGGKVARIRIRVPGERAQEIYRALFRGEKILVVGL